MKVISRFPRTPKAVKEAVSIADATIQMDNSREMKHAFTICRIQMDAREIYDIRKGRRKG